MATWDDLRGRSLARQFPQDDPAPATLVEVTGPIQSQTARSPFIGLAARSTAVTHETVTAAYEAGELVRGSTLRGTVHTCTSAQHPLLHAGTRRGVGGRWQQLLGLEPEAAEQLWADLEAYADEWRTPQDLTGFLSRWLVTHTGRDDVTSDGPGRYLSFAHGGLVRRPATGPWSGQGAPVYRAVPDPPGSLADLLLLHLRCHGPASRQDLAWWSGLRLTLVTELVAGLDVTEEPGPDDRSYLDLPDAPEPRELPGARLLPEFDALLCAYDSKRRDRFVTPEHHAVLWNSKNGLLASPLLVDGRITGWWRAAGSATRRPLEVHWFAGTRKPRKAELAEAVTRLEAGLGITVTDLTVTRVSA